MIIRYRVAVADAERARAGGAAPRAQPVTMYTGMPAILEPDGEEQV